MTKLNQVIAIEESAKKNEYADLSKAHHVLQKNDLFNGFIRNWRTRLEDGVVYPDEKKVVQQNAASIIRLVEKQLAEVFDIVATKNYGNCNAKADVVVNGAVLIEQAPAVYLIFLEKQLVDLRTFVSKLPVLDPAREWTYDANKGMYATSPEEKIKTRKVQKAIVKYEATKEHPAQTELVSVDEVEGVWVQVDLSTAFPADQIRQMLDRIGVLEVAVKQAREQANSIDVPKVNVGNKVLSFIFGI